MKFKFLFVFLLLPAFAFASPELDRAKSLNRGEDYIRASRILYRLLNNSKYKREKSEIYYELGRSFEGMGLRQSAVYVLINAVKSSPGANLSKYLRVLSRLAFDVGDDVGLNYALSKINIKKFPESEKSVLYFRFGQAYLKSGQFKKAVRAFNKIPKKHPLYAKARYFLGLALSERGSLKSSYYAFTQAANARSEGGVVDRERVAALMGRARVLYHMKRWEDSINAYRMVPRDSEYFHDRLFEEAWAQMRAGKFRSALSNFQSLHSEYYNDYLYPEATLLRAIIYLYICKEQEVNQVLKVYEKTYGKMNKRLKRYLKVHKSPKSDLKNYLALREFMDGNTKFKKDDFAIPYVILRHINRSSKVKARAQYYFNLTDEKDRIASIQGLSGSPLVSYSNKIIDKRLKGAFKRLGLSLREELLKTKRQLAEFGDQKELIKFELIESEKERARKKLEARDDFDPKVKEKTSRFDYTKNGYEYWPFKGEYWLDEIGNYHYLGVSRCEK